jgi:phosphonate transport system substrate-binding protein
VRSAERENSMTLHLNRRCALVALTGGLTGLAGRPAAAQGTRPLELGLLPNLSARILLAQYQSVREFIERRLQRSVQVSTAPNWNAFYRRTADLDYDVAVTAANMARVAQLDAGYLPLVSYAPQIKGLVVVAKQRPLRGIAELRGQRLALSNPQSLVTLRGMQWLADRGLNRPADFTTLDTPTDDSVGNLVVRGECAAAMLSGGEFRAIPEDIRGQLQVLVNFADVPSFIVIASPKLPPTQAATVKQALLDLSAGSDEGKAFFAASGFTAMTEATPALMEQLDVYAADTRRLFAAR